MKYKTGDLLISTDQLIIDTKNHRREQCKKNRYFLIIGTNNQSCELICQETGSISVWPVSALKHCFNKV